MCYSWGRWRKKWVKHNEMLQSLFFYSCSPKVMSHLQRPISLKTNPFGQGVLGTFLYKGHAGRWPLLCPCMYSGDQLQGGAILLCIREPWPEGQAAASDTLWGNACGHWLPSKDRKHFPESYSQEVWSKCFG